VNHDLVNDAPNAVHTEFIHSAAKNAERKFYGNVRDAASRRNENILEANPCLQRNSFLFYIHIFIIIFIFD